MRLIRPLATVAETTTPCARPGTLYSAAYFAVPVTFARPSTREVGLPRWLVAVMAPSRLAPTFVEKPVHRLLSLYLPSLHNLAFSRLSLRRWQVLGDPLVRLRLRGAARRLGQGAQDAAPRQRDLE